MVMSYRFCTANSTFEERFLEIIILHSLYKNQATLSRIGKQIIFRQFQLHFICF